MSGKVHPQAFIEEGAQIGENVTVEPFAVIKKGVILEKDVTVMSHAYIDGNTHIGEGTRIYPSASIGTHPQHRSSRGENTRVVIGKNCAIREFVTINSSIQEGSVVSIGDNCLLMAYSHVAHNCEIGNWVVMANHATLAGHIVIEDHVTIGGMTPIHQFVRVGCHSMVGGMSRVTHDIPPYTLGAGVPYKFGGLNLIGLKRRGFALEARQALSKAFRYTYRSKLHLDEALEKIKNEIPATPEVEHWVQFCQATQRGLIGLHGAAEDFHDETTLLEDSAEEFEPALS